MSDALDRIVPEDKKGRGGNGLYRHDAEGSDDMPVFYYVNCSVLMKKTANWGFLCRHISKALW